MFSIGSDPEFMLVGRVKDRVAYKSAIGLLPDQKHALSQKGHQFYYENVVAECGLKPAETKDEFLSNIRECLNILAAKIWPLRFCSKAAYYYPDEELLHPDALKAACKEDWCAYDLLPKEAPKEIIRDTCFRGAGGHIHIGSRFLEDAAHVPHVVRMLDLFLSIPFVLIDQDKTSRDRREIYGQAGRHRITKYGLEYRTPGNYWLCSPKMAGLVYDVCQFVLEFVADEKHLKFWSEDDDPEEDQVCFGYDVDLLRDSIDNCDKRSASKFMIIIDSILPNDLILQIERLHSRPVVDPYQEWAIL